MPSIALSRLPRAPGATSRCGYSRYWLHATRLGFDETSSRKGQDANVAIQRYLASKEVKPEQIIAASVDMSHAFMAGVGKAFPKAKITFDRFHVVKLLNEAMDTVRKLERRARGYRNIQNFINMAYFLCGKLDFSFSRRSPA